MIPGLSHRKTGANDHTFSGAVKGHKLRATVKANGWEFSLSGAASFAVMTDNEIANYWALLSDAIKEAMQTSYKLRHENPPMFDLPDQSIISTRGVNEW